MATAAWSVSPSVGSRRCASRRSADARSRSPARRAPVNAVSASRRLRSARFGLRSAALSSLEMAPTTSPRSRVRSGGFLDRRGDLLVRRVGGFGEVMAAPLGLIGEELGQPLMGRAPLVVRRALDHHRLEDRVPEPQLADAVIDHDEVVAFGRPEVIESSRAARRRQHSEVAAAVQRGEQEQATRWLGEPLDPRLVQRSQLPARAGRSPWCRRCRAGRRPMRRTPATPADCPAPPRRRAAGGGSAGGRTGASATPSPAGVGEWRDRRTPAIRRARRTRRHPAGSRRGARSGRRAAAGRRTRRRRRWHDPASAGRRRR